MGDIFGERYFGRQMIYFHIWHHQASAMTTVLGATDLRFAQIGISNAETPSLNFPRFPPLRLVRHLPYQAKRRNHPDTADGRQPLT